MQRVFLFLSMVLVLANCQPTNVSSSTDESSAKAEGGQLLQVTANDPEDVNGVVNQAGETPTPGGGMSGGAGLTGGGNPPGQLPPGIRPDGDGQYVCILDGPGKSVKLGQTSTLGGQNGVGHPSVLCMSREACLQIASQAFVVKGPEFRGYCKLPQHNPHVAHVTNAELQTKVNAFLKK